MKFNIADLPAVKAQLELDVSAVAEATAQREVSSVEYVDAPAASGPAATGARPPALQGATR